MKRFKNILCSKATKNIRLFYSFICFFLICTSISFSQNDTIRLKNNDMMVGEIKAYSQGVLTFKTKYSDSDFQVKFHQISELNVQRKSLIVLTGGRRRFGYIKSTEPGKVLITFDDGKTEIHNLSDIIALQEVRDKFLKRLEANIDISYTFAKSNNSSQFTIAGALKYTSELWILNGSISKLNSNQDDVDKIQRTDANVSFMRILPKKLYLIGEVPFLSNTEQALKARIGPSVAIGKLLASTNSLYWGVSLGLTWNIENYEDSSLDKNSTELLISSLFNIYNMDDFDITSDIKIYPSLSESGRVRTDFNLNLKYDLPLDFYIKLGFNLNYDNRPAIAGNDVDYFFTSGFGWEFN